MDLLDDPLLAEVPVKDGFKRLDVFLIVERLGAGGMGAVYRARHHKLPIDRAIKCLVASEGGTESIQRFEREAHVAASIEHPNLVQVFDIRHGHGLHYIVMEFVDGSSLHQQVRGHGAMEPRQACEVILQAARGLAAAHARGIVHRDVKPGNVMLRNDGVLKVVDLGLAKATQEVDGLLTATHAFLGTPQYMAPEQYDGAASAGPPADVYGLAATLVFLLTGKDPFPGKSSSQIMKTLFQEGFPCRVGRLARMPAPLTELIARATSADAALRQGDAGAFAEELEECLTQLGSAEARAPVPRVDAANALLTHTPLPADVGTTPPAASATRHPIGDAPPRPPGSKAPSRTPPIDERRPDGATDPPLTAGAIRRAESEAERAIAKWTQVVGAGPESIAPDVRATGARKAEDLQQALDAERYPEIAGLVDQLGLLTEQLSRQQDLQREMTTLQRRSLSMRQDAAKVDAGRLAPSRIAAADRFARRAAESASNLHYEVAAGHLREEVVELERAISESRESKEAEIRGFAEDVHQLMESALDPGSREARRAAGASAKRHHLSKDDAGAIARLVMKRETPILTAKDIAEVMWPDDTGLGLSRAQRLGVIARGARGWWMLAMVIAVLLLPVIAITFTASRHSDSPWAAVAGALCVSAISGALLLVPLRVASRRPVGRRSLWVSLLVASALAALLTLLALLAVAVLVETGDLDSTSDEFVGIASVATLLVVWPVWAVVFWAASKGKAGVQAVNHLYDKLIRGSILELVVAVPCHLLARRKDDCSAAVPSAMGIVLGAGIAVIAFGPSLYILYATKFDKIRLRAYEWTWSNRQRARLWWVLALEGVAGGWAAMILVPEAFVLYAAIGFALVVAGSVALVRR